MKPANISCSVLVMIGLFALSPSINAARNPNPGVLPVDSTPHGMSYGEWGAAYWQWALSRPADRNPLTDTTGEFCDEGQSGSVWFLAGTFGGDAERSCTIPTGKSIFFPIVTILFGAAVFDCEPTGVGECDFDVLLDGAEDAMDLALPENDGSLEVMIDGVPLEDVYSYRASSPNPFAITLPDNSVIGVPEGTYEPHATDGYWVFLHPLAPGEHTITFSASLPNYPPSGFSLAVTYHITVEP